MNRHHLLAPLRRNPHPVYSLLRRVAPVVRLRRGVWACFDHASVRRALHDPETFSSRAAPPGGEPLDWLIFQDAPRHTKLRGLIMRAFTPRAVQALEPGIAGIVQRILEPAARRGEIDVVTELAEPLPTLVIMQLLGMPASDAAPVRRWTDGILGLGDTILGGERAARAAAAYRAAKAEMRPYLETLMAARRDAPRDDLISRLMLAEIDGERLGAEDIFAFFQLLLLAGSETTTNLIANAVLTLLEHPQQLAAVRAEPASLPRAIEEVLRYRSPVQMVFRRTTQDVELRGRTIPSGQLVLLMVGSANRDPRVYPRADKFDVSREPTPHLAFGFGAHFCLGAALARLEARVALAALLRYDMQLTTPRWAPRAALNVLGPERLPVRLGEARGARGQVR